MNEILSNNIASLANYNNIHFCYFSSHTSHTNSNELENFSQDHSPKNYSYDQVRVYADVDRSFLIEIATRCRRAFREAYLFARKIGGGFADGGSAECRAVPIAFTLPSSPVSRRDAGWAGCRMPPLLNYLWRSTF